MHQTIFAANDACNIDKYIAIRKYFVIIPPHNNRTHLQFFPDIQKIILYLPKMKKEWNLSEKPSIIDNISTLGACIIKKIKINQL